MRNGLRDLEKLLVDLLQGIDTLLQLDVVGWELSLGQPISFCLGIFLNLGRGHAVPCHQQCRAAPLHIAVFELRRVRRKSCPSH